jgi:dTMP kinase
MARVPYRKRGSKPREALQFPFSRSDDGCVILLRKGRTIRRMVQRGMLIAVEGIDGAGKTTQVSLLAQALRDAGEEPVCSKEPTSGFWGQKIKESASNGRMSLDDELNAFINDRTEHVEKLIQPSLADGRLVILDRYYFSTIAYQGARGADARAIKVRMESSFPVPDVVFILDLDPDVSIRRISALRGDRPNEFERVDHLNQARWIFNSLRDDYIVRIDGALPIADVHGQLLYALSSGPLKRKRCAKGYGCDNPFDCAFRLGGQCEWWELKSKLALKFPAVEDRVCNLG